MTSPTSSKTNERRLSATALSAKSRQPQSALSVGAQTLSVPDRCACGGGCPRCAATSLPSILRSRAESVQGVDFSNARIHENAPNVTEPLHARAVTRGQDIYFHPGAYRPHTLAGDALIAHELAHTRQTRANTANDNAASVVSRPGDALERNADALARGRATQVVPAPSGAVLRSPFDSESADDRTRREALLQSISNATNTLLRLLRTRGLIQNTEVAVERNGVRGIIYGAHTAGTADETFTSYPDRDARIRRIIRSLMAMGTLYRSAPIPADFSAPTITDSGDYESTVTYPAGSDVSSSNYGGADTEWVDLQAAYERYRITQGQTGEEFDSDWYYLDPSNQIVPGAAGGAPPLSSGIQTGAYVVVPDMQHEPLRYWRLTGSSPVPRGSVIVEFLHDDFGYYYMSGDQRIDVPNPWS